MRLKHTGSSNMGERGCEYQLLGLRGSKPLDWAYSSKNNFLSASFHISEKTKKKKKIRTRSLN